MAESCAVLDVSISGCQANGIRPRHKRRSKALTNFKRALPVAPKLLARNFNPAKPNQVWSVDTTCLWTDEGWPYRAVIFGPFNREVVCWSIKPFYNLSHHHSTLGYASPMNFLECWSSTQHEQQLAAWY